MMVMMILLVLVSALTGNCADIKNVFSATEVSFCTRIRGPQIVGDAEETFILVIARCCGANRCSSKTNKGRDDFPPLDDNNKDGTVIMKKSTDGGQSWGNFKVISPIDSRNKPLLGYSCGAGIWDGRAKRIVVQHQFFRGDGSTTPTVNTSYFQIMSSDMGDTWTPAVDITRMISKCNPDINNMMQISAGNKIQTPSGRLVWGGHDHAGRVCVWFSDDGGNSYNTSNLVQGNEVSVVNIEGSNLLMNGRGQQFSNYNGHRANYFSTDNGASWSGPSESALLDDDGHGCERSMLNIDGILYTVEPQGKDRTSMTISCSKDGGKTWPSSRGINGDAPGGYSDLIAINDGILVLWEDGNTGNILSTQIGKAWC